MQLVVALQPAEQVWEGAASVGQHQLEPGVTRGHTAEKQAPAGDGGFATAPYGVDEPVGGQARVVGEHGMDEQRQSHASGGRPHRVEVGVIELVAVDLRSDHGADEARRPHLSEHLGCRMRVLQGQGGERHEARLVRNRCGERVVEHPAPCHADIRRQVVRGQVGPSHHDLHVHATRVQPPQTHVDARQRRRQRPRRRRADDAELPAIPSASARTVPPNNPREAAARSSGGT